MIPIDMDPGDVMPGYGQLKADGMRALYIDGRIVSREGVPLNCALHCLPDLRRLEKAFGREMVFDGEYVEEDGYDATMRALRRGWGEGVFWIFDAVPLDEWIADKCRQPFEERMAGIAHHIDLIQSPFVGFLTPFWLPTSEAVEAKARELWAMGYEGIVVKKPGSRYCRDKSAHWRRWKQTLTFDATIMDVLVDDGKLRGIMVRGPDGPTSTLKITTGFSEADKREILADGEQRIVELAYNTKAGSTKPRHARFVRFRRDKEGMKK